MELQDYIRNIPDFPEPGIQFKDITTLTKNGPAFHKMIDELADSLKNYPVDLIIGPEARGFLFGAPLAYAMGVGFVIARKPGKLPAKTIRHEYELEYGSDALEVHADAIQPGARVALIDDLLATGGTAHAVAKLVEKSGGEVVAIRFAIELTGLNGRETLKKYDVQAMISFDD